MVIRKRRYKGRSVANVEYYHQKVITRMQRADRVLDVCVKAIIVMKYCVLSESDVQSDDCTYIEDVPVEIQ